MSRVPYSLTAIRSDDDSSGKNIVPYASVSVVDANGNPAQIYLQETGGSPSSHFALNENGFKQIWAEPGRYTITIDGGETYDIFLTGDLSDRVQSVATIADLTTLTGIVDGQIFDVKEYSTGLGWGGGRIKAVSGSAAANNVLTFPSATDGIYFERMDVSVIDCDMAGIAGDGVTDDTVRLQAAITAGAGRRVYLNRHCRLTSVGLQIPSNTIMEFGSNGFLELLPHNSQNYAILGVHDVGNVTLINPKVDGRRDLNSATTGEWGMGISIRGTTGKVQIINPVANNCWGDGYYIGATPNLGWCDDVEIVNVIDSCQMEIISVVYNKQKEMFYVKARNTGSVDCYMDVEMRDVVVNNVKRTIGSDEARLIKAGKSSNIYISQRLDEDDLKDNSFIKVYGYYGQRKESLVNVVIGNFEVIIRAFSTITWVIIVLIIF